MILHRNLTNHEEKKDGFSMGPQQSAGCATSRGRGTHVTVGSAYSDMVAQEEAAKRHNYGVYIYILFRGVSLPSFWGKGSSRPSHHVGSLYIFGVQDHFFERGTSSSWT